MFGPEVHPRDDRFPFLLFQLLEALKGPSTRYRNLDDIVAAMRLEGTTVGSLSNSASKSPDGKKSARHLGFDRLMRLADLAKAEGVAADQDVDRIVYCWLRKSADMNLIAFLEAEEDSSRAPSKQWEKKREFLVKKRIQVYRRTGK